MRTDGAAWWCRDTCHAGKIGCKQQKLRLLMSLSKFRARLRSSKPLANSCKSETAVTEKQNTHGATAVSGAAAWKELRPRSAKSLARHRPFFLTTQREKT